jgi:hypothetical protein
MEHDFDSFIKATRAFFGEPTVSIDEFKSLTQQDRADISRELNKVPGFSHPQYVPKAE